MTDAVDSERRPAAFDPLAAMSPGQREVWQLRQEGLQPHEIAAELGLSRHVVSKRLYRAKKWVNCDPGVAQALQAAGTSPEMAKHAWLKSDNSSIFVTIPREQSGGLERYAEAVKEAFEDVPKVQPTSAPPVDTNLMTRVVVTDVHLGLKATKARTGADYDLSIAGDKFREASAELIERSPKSQVGLIQNLGDFFHANDSREVTYYSGHKLDVAAAFPEISYEGAKCMDYLMQCALARFGRVVYVAAPANHDVDQIHSLTTALRLRYESDPRITIIPNQSGLYAYEWGRCMIGAHHGHRTKPQQLVLAMADTHAEMWGRTYWRYLDTGHGHHERAEAIGGVRWKQYTSFCAPGNYEADLGLVGRHMIESVTCDADHGQVSSTSVGVVYG